MPNQKEEMYIIYDERAMFEDTDNAIVISCCDTSCEFHATAYL